MPRIYRIACLPGDGIGPEVVDAARRVVESAAIDQDYHVEFESHATGGAAIDSHGDPLPESTLKACLTSDGILLGAVGGPKWDSVARELRPETGLLRLRKELGVYANLRPVSVPAVLAGGSPLRPESVAGTDLLVVRELTGGIYFGEPRGIESGEGFNTMRYSEDEVERIARVAFEWARRRRRSVVSVDKANVLEASVLWRDVVTRLHSQDYQDIELDHLYVDNAAMQIVLDPGRFDVILTGNLFGDILSDLAATLPGSLGLLPSASVGGRVGLFEPVHGSAPEIAGEDTANPIAAVLSAAMLFDELAEPETATRIRSAVEAVLDAGFRTPDLYRQGMKSVGTTEMTTAIVDRLQNLKNEQI